MPFEAGYNAGLTNDRECPHPPLTVAAIFWHLGNDIGVRVHCAVVESVYVNSTHEEGN